MANVSGACDLAFMELELKRTNIRHSFIFNAKKKKEARMVNVSGTYNLKNCYLHEIEVEKDKHKTFIYFQCKKKKQLE